MKVGIVGAGHNALVLAGYLALDGFQVEVFERSKQVGGLCVTEELFPGYKVSTVASFFGMLRRRVIEDLELERFGFQPYLTDPAEIVLLSDGDYIITPRDGSGSKYSIDGLEQEQLEGWNQFWSDIGKGASVLSRFYFKPESTNEQLHEELRKNKMDRLADAIFSDSLLNYMENFFSNEKLKAAASTCTPGYASLPGTVFGCLHHGTAETCGVEGAWGLVKGGMGAITQAMQRSCEEKGVIVFMEKEVKRITVLNGEARGLEFVDGEKRDFDVIVSGADYKVTFGKLLKGEKKIENLPDIFSSIPSTVSAGKIHFTLKKLPSFPALEKLGHNYAGIIVSAPPLDSIIADSNTVPLGKMPTNLMMTLSIPSVTDDTIAPAGMHLLNVDVHQLPTQLNGKPWNLEGKEALKEKTLEQLEKLAPDVRDCIVESYVVSPQEFKTDYGADSMCCWQLPMTEYPFEKRNINGLPAYHTPLKNLFVAGAGTYGGGNVTGVSGFNCAQEIIKIKEKVHS